MLQHQQRKVQGFNPVYKAAARDSETAFRKQLEKEKDEAEMVETFANLQSGVWKGKKSGAVIAVLLKKEEKYNLLWNVSFREKHCHLCFKKINFGMHMQCGNDKVSRWLLCVAIRNGDTDVPLCCSHEPVHFGNSLF